MKILYVLPGTMSKTHLRAEELERRKSILQSNAGKDVKVIDIFFEGEIEGEKST